MCTVSHNKKVLGKSGMKAESIETQVLQWQNELAWATFIKPQASKMTAE